MKTIKKIFFTDLKKLSKNFFALVIAIGVCFLPALYAWCNIYSNWDPYGNTGGLKLAAVSLDKGYTLEDGTYENVGKSVMDSLAENDAVDWQFVDSQEEALNGVKKGDYYAAIIITEDFTYNMYNVFSTNFEKPTLIFYENQKKNAVAAKISDTVVATVESNINEEFIKVMATTVFAGANEVADDIKEDGGLEGLLAKIEKTNEQLKDYEKAIDAIIVSNDVLKESVSEGQKDAKEMANQSAKSGQSLEEAQTSLSQAQVTLKDYNNQVNKTLTDVSNTLESLSNDIDAYQNSADTKARVEAADKAFETSTALYNPDAKKDKDGYFVMDDPKELGSLQSMENAMVAIVDTKKDAEKEQLTDAEEALTAVQTIEAEVVSTQGELRSLGTDGQKAADATLEATAKVIDSSKENIDDAKTTYQTKLAPNVQSTIDGLNKTLSSANDLMNSMSTTLANMGDIFAAVQNTLSSANTSLEKTRDAISAISDKLTEALTKAEGLSEDDAVKMIINTLSGNPDQYGEFFSEPVEIQTEKVYPVENYGSAVTPFYTCLAIWVGVIILAAVFQTKPNESKYPGAKPHELFFGRYMFFFLMAQVQTLVTVLGNIYLLGIQCIHPVYFWLASALACLVFSLIIFSLIFAFGDIGKAASVVLIVLQIAGSSGTYPIELLPEFFQKVYIFFPFPYAINAMRECIAGMYHQDYLVYMLQLSLFIFVGLLIGLVIHKPFREVNEYMEERMEDSGLM